MQRSAMRVGHRQYRSRIALRFMTGYRHRNLTIEMELELQHVPSQVFALREFGEFLVYVFRRHLECGAGFRIRDG